jgi:hypothetical protein
MEYDLVRRLKTCSARERLNVATLLGKTRTDIAIKELTNMVEGGRRNWLRWYDYNDQLTGIIALSETMSPKICDYLISLKKEEVKCDGGGHYYDENGQNPEIRSIKKIKYLNVNGSLRKKLDHTEITISQGNGDLIDTLYYGDQEVEKRFKEVIETAINKLQIDLSCNSRDITL